MTQHLVEVEETEEKKGIWKEEKLLEEGENFWTGQI